ncbi:Rrf2 family transcriptional regulator [Anaeromassilibacillus sp. SJQ-1]|uniref:Rrf2 family transcriptional regulator n=1 Tax=Anaeromassilibacillus sp. SJQ-1 TaxID=3375419 RepID=UPI003989C1F9
MRQVIESVEGPYVISRCQQREYSCTHTASCRFHEIYSEISKIVREKLDSYTFADVSGFDRFCIPESFQRNPYIHPRIPREKMVGNKSVLIRVFMKTCGNRMGRTYFIFIRIKARAGSFNGLSCYVCYRPAAG